MPTPSRADVGIGPYALPTMVVPIVGTTIGRPFGCVENVRTGDARPYVLPRVAMGEDGVKPHSRGAVNDN
ncbi:MAG: hypothetical protein IJN76_01235 [Clostridia bacterium]|nr:hypothetical protein [Clostridia bacterium]